MCFSSSPELAPFFLFFVPFLFWGFLCFPLMTGQHIVFRWGALFPAKSSGFPLELRKQEAPPKKRTCQVLPAEAVARRHGGRLLFVVRVFLFFFFFTESQTYMPEGGLRNGWFVFFFFPSWHLFVGGVRRETKGKQPI